jgi:hypothetical protein
MNRNDNDNETKKKSYMNQFLLFSGCVFLVGAGKFVSLFQQLLE